MDVLRHPFSLGRGREGRTLRGKTKTGRASVDVQRKIYNGLRHVRFLFVKENVVSRLIARLPENMRAREWVCRRSGTPRRENYHDDDLRALTDAEHALTSVAVFCHFYGLPVPKIWPLSFAKRNTLVSKPRKHDTSREKEREKEKRREGVQEARNHGQGPRTRITRLSYNLLLGKFFASWHVSSNRENFLFRRQTLESFIRLSSVEFL